VDRAFCRDKAVSNGFHHLINTGFQAGFCLAPMALLQTQPGHRSRKCEIQRARALKARFTFSPTSSAIGVCPNPLSKVILHMFGIENDLVS
jgi:hypothetical protein